jgi:hypothetical protein
MTKVSVEPDTTPLSVPLNVQMPQPAPKTSPETAAPDCETVHWKPPEPEESEADPEYRPFRFTPASANTVEWQNKAKRNVATLIRNGVDAHIFKNPSPDHSELSWQPRRQTVRRGTP